VFEFSVAVEIAAPVGRVWRALCRPEEVVQWDASVVAAVETPPGYPLPGQHALWRCRSGPFRLLHDRPQEVVPERRLRSWLSLGPFHYDETYDIEPSAQGCRLTARVRVRTALPVFGAVINGLYAGPAARRAWETSLAGLKCHCQAVA
jgi:hypothetical protein